LLVSLTACGKRPDTEVSESGRYLIEARQAIGDGNTAKALATLTESIKSEPNTWAYLERAKLYAKQGSDQAAADDCKEVLKLDPENRDVAWLQGELRKAKEKRFQGRFAFPPSASK
jgi:Tfp pilus assembly protein PilF